MTYQAAVITVSDRGARGERTDTSGPAICGMLESAGYEVVYTVVIPDEMECIREELMKCADELGCALVVTTGGTGFSPRDVTPEATVSVMERPTPGISEAMRAESMKITLHGCLSRGTAGIRGRTLIVNLPGSEKAVRENLEAVIRPIRHGLDMLYSSGSADCGRRQENTEKSENCGQIDSEVGNAPSLDEWLRDAKSDPAAGKVGMYLTHCGVVRETARARVRGGDGEAPSVRGMYFSYDADRLHSVIEETRKLDGICIVRVWLNEGYLKVGDDIMRVLVGGDIRSHVTDALLFLVGRIKEECVSEREDFG